MRILITKQLPLDAPGGEASHMLAIARELRDLGQEIHLMPATKSAAPASLWPREFVHDVPPFGLHRFLDSFAISRAAADFMRQTPVDAVLSWQYETAYLSSFTHSRDFVQGVIAGYPFAYVKRTAGINPARRIIPLFFHFRQLRQAQVIYSPSFFVKNDLSASFKIDPQKIVVTPLGADSVFQPAARPPTGPLKNFIFSGAFIPLKGIFDALTALGLVAQRNHSDWTLNIIGWGDVEAVRSAARAAGIEQRIRFQGRLDRPTLAGELARADLAILPSHTETFGLSIAEAQAAGLPVISYHTGAIPEVVQNGETGILVRPRDPSALAEAILHLIENPAQARRMGERGASFMRANFSWRKAAETMLESLQFLRQRQKSGRPLTDPGQPT